MFCMAKRNDMKGQDAGVGRTEAGCTGLNNTVEMGIQVRAKESFIANFFGAFVRVHLTNTSEDAFGTYAFIFYVAVGLKK